jgi:hypothetical protein
MTASKYLATIKHRPALRLLSAIDCFHCPRLPSLRTTDIDEDAQRPDCANRAK